MVQISEMNRLIKLFGQNFVIRTFTKDEVRHSVSSTNQEEFFSTRFAAKEATFKAIAHFTKKKGFDFRMVETLNESDGYPVITPTPRLKQLLAEAGIDSIHISITTQGDYAIAFAVANKTPN